MELKYNERYSWYEGDVTIGQSIINVIIEETEEAEALLEKFKANFDTLDKSCREFAADELLEGANDWLDSNDDEDALEEYTRDMFLNLMAPESVFISKSGNYSMGYADGDMFFGHSIVVDASGDGQPEFADIAG